MFKIVWRFQKIEVMFLSIEEVSLSQGEGCIFITHKQEREKVINTSAQTIQYNLDNILNFFNHRNTNANAASFNSKIKLFKANLREVTDIAFFLFRLKNLLPNPQKNQVTHI